MGWAKNIQESNETWPYKIKIVHFIDSCLFCLIVVVFLQRATFTNEDFEIFVHSCFQSYQQEKWQNYFWQAIKKLNGQI